jgi:hypothetical protein
MKFDMNLEYAYARNLLWLVCGNQYKNKLNYYILISFHYLAADFLEVNDYIVLIYELSDITFLSLWCLFLKTFADILCLHVIWKSMIAVRHIYLFSYFPGISSEFESWEENMFIETDDVENNLLQEKRFVFLREHCYCKPKSKYFQSHIFCN